MPAEDEPWCIVNEVAMRSAAALMLLCLLNPRSTAQLRAVARRVKLLRVHEIYYAKG